MAKRSRTLFPAYNDTECDVCFGTIWEGEELGFVEGEKACQDCWELAEMDE